MVALFAGPLQFHGSPDVWSDEDTQQRGLSDGHSVRRQLLTGYERDD